MAGKQALENEIEIEVAMYLVGQCGISWNSKLKHWRKCFVWLKKKIWSKLLTKLWLLYSSKWFVSFGKDPISFLIMVESL